MKYLAALLTMLPISACVTRTEYLPLYLEIQPDKPAPPDLETVDVQFDETSKVFVLTPQEFDDLKNNLLEMEKYIELLISGWVYYEDATSQQGE